jgi:hypothetical protein
VRISASDWADGGWNIEESVQLSKLKSVDLIDVFLGGGVSHQQIALGPNTKCSFAERIKKGWSFDWSRRANH